jgi:acetaldehyde dehydrogenase/alcohol dehydrogenase
MQDTVNDEKSLKKVIEQVRKAQEIYECYTQEQVDNIFFAVAKRAVKARVVLAKMAVEETGMGAIEDKVVKNHYAAEYIYNRYKNEKTCGVIEQDEAFGLTKIAEPLGVLAALIPTTNPTSTVIFKVLISLKTRNGLMICPHPRAKKCTVEAAKILLRAAEEAGAPKGSSGG